MLNAHKRMTEFFAASAACSAYSACCVGSGAFAPATLEDTFVADYRFSLTVDYQLITTFAIGTCQICRLTTPTLTTLATQNKVVATTTLTT